MKPCRILLLAVFFFPFPVAGQLSGGFYGGLNSSKLRGDAPKDVVFGNLLNGDIGVFLDWNIKELFTISFQPYYTRKGTKVSFRFSKELDPVDSAKIYFSYISFPLAVKVMAKNKRWYALGSVETAKPVKSYLKYINRPDEKIDIENYVSGINVYLNFGVGRRWSLGRDKRLFFEVKYFQALINTIQEGKVAPAYVPRLRSRGFQITGGMEFSFKHNK